MEAFDLDALIAEQEAEQYAGPLGIVWGYLTTAELEQVSHYTYTRRGERRRTTTVTGTIRFLPDRPAHAWRSDHWQGFRIGVHRFTVFDLDLRCGCPQLLYNTWDEYRDAGGCQCVGVRLHRVQCDDCAWCATGSEPFTIAAAHDHAAPGWRDLPAVPAEFRPERGGPLRHEKHLDRSRVEKLQVQQAIDFVDAHYPEWAKSRTMPTIVRDRPDNHSRGGISGHGVYEGFELTEFTTRVTAPSDGIGGPGWALPIKMQDWEAARARGEAGAP